MCFASGWLLSWSLGRHIAQGFAECRGRAWPRIQAEVCRSRAHFGQLRAHLGRHLVPASGKGSRQFGRIPRSMPRVAPQRPPRELPGFDRVDHPHGPDRCRRRSSALDAVHRRATVAALPRLRIWAPRVRRFPCAHKSRRRLGARCAQELLQPLETRRCECSATPCRGPWSREICKIRRDALSQLRPVGGLAYACTCLHLHCSISSDPLVNQTSWLFEHPPGSVSAPLALSS